MKVQKVHKSLLDLLDPHLSKRILFFEFEDLIKCKVNQEEESYTLTVLHTITNPDHF
jgi:hypothetical protein